MRNMSFMLTTEQVRNRTKTVTRRLGWANLKPGELFRMCEKCQGLKKGEQVNVLGVGRCLSNRPERLDRLIDEPEYGLAEAILEGFPELDGPAFVAMFCEHMRTYPRKIINRIEFEYV